MPPTATTPRPPIRRSRPDPEYLHKQLDFSRRAPNRRAGRHHDGHGGQPPGGHEGLAAYYDGRSSGPRRPRTRTWSRSGRSSGAAATRQQRAGLRRMPWAGRRHAGAIPALAGQYADTRRPAQGVQGRRQANDPNRMMRGVTARMTDREIRAVAEYAAGLR
jgi:hypothetical protein